MKLIRKGELNEESPGLLLPDGREVDVSSFGEDYDEVFFETNGLERLSEWLKEIGEDLPPFPENERYGSPIARPSKIVCIGLNYDDHARESGMEIPPEPVISCSMKIISPIGLTLSTLSRAVLLQDCLHIVVAD